MLSTNISELPVGQIEHVVQAVSPSQMASQSQVDQLFFAIVVTNKLGKFLACSPNFGLADSPLSTLCDFS